MFNRVAADGSFAAAGGGLDWVVPDAEIDARGASGTAGTDTILFGRRTYEMFESFWPRALDDSATSPDPHAEGRRSPEMRAMAVWINAATKVVFSRSRREVSWNNSRLVAELDPAGVEAMKRGPGKDIMIFGSGSIVSELTRQGLIDEYHFVVGPLILGGGRPLFTGISDSVDLELIEATPFRSGNVVLRYAKR
jgi:dihydrofolate reductase